MALLHSADRVSGSRADARPLPQRGIHPAICLVAGFGFIVASALAVHVIFNALM